MMDKKYELIESDFVEEFGVKLFRIKALRSFDSVEYGDLGGYIRSKESLSHDGNAWVGDKAKVSGEAVVRDNARVEGNARVDNSAMVVGDSLVSGNAKVEDNAIVVVMLW